MTPKQWVFRNVIFEFLEFCYNHPEVNLDPSYFYGKEKEIITQFLFEREEDDT